MTATQQPRIFITHSSRNIGFARRLFKDLKATGFEIWFDDKSLQAGQRLAEQINRGLEWCDVYIPILSSASLASQWCTEEINAAITLSNDPQRVGRPRIIPVLIEQCEDRMPALLRARLFIQFGGRYDEALQELKVRGLGMPTHTAPSPSAYTSASLSRQQLTPLPQAATPPPQAVTPPPRAPVRSASSGLPGWTISAGLIGVIFVLLIICGGVSLFVLRELLKTPLPPVTTAWATTVSPRNITVTPSATTPSAPGPVPPMPTTVTPSLTPTRTSTPTPTPTLTRGPQWNTVFEDLFNDSALDSSKWVVNNPSGEVLLSGSVLRLSSSSNRFPYVYPRNDPFPTRGDFRFVAQFRYVRVDDCGVGILVTSFLSTPGTPLNEHNRQMESAEQSGITAGVWQGTPDNMQIWYRSGSERPSQRVSANDTSSHTMEIRYLGNQYTILLDGNSIYASSPTSARPRTIWLGHPAALGGSCRWSTLEIDSIRVEGLY